jgi:methylmalonyl-CoA/ethylmalonyl-CoA epimerase
MLPYNVDHVGIAVRDLDASIQRYEQLFGATPLHRERVESQGVEEAMIAVGGSFVQLLEAIDSDSPVGRFVDRRGEGLHHIADPVARPGSRGTRIAFVHPRSFAGTLIELVELPV